MPKTCKSVTLLFAAKANYMFTCIGSTVRAYARHNYRRLQN
jgi:hypothetical protein